MAILADLKMSSGKTAPWPSLAMRVRPCIDGYCIVGASTRGDGDRGHTCISVSSRLIQPGKPFKIRDSHFGLWRMETRKWLFENSWEHTCPCVSGLGHWAGDRRRAGRDA